jgi:hypothetical protein
MTETLAPFKDPKYLPLEEALKQVGAYQPKQAATKNVPNQRVFLKLEDIACIGSDGEPFEQYKTIYVANDIERSRQKGDISVTIYDAISHFNKVGENIFLPSYALTCNILAALYAMKDTSPEAKAILDQYKDDGSGSSYNGTNTIIDWKDKRIIHYPNKPDFQVYTETDAINIREHIIKPFRMISTTDGRSYKDALRDAETRMFIKDLTGLRNPEIILDIAEYFEKTAWFVDYTDDVYTTWVGCTKANEDFGIANCSDRVTGRCSTRGVWTP